MSHTLEEHQLNVRAKIRKAFARLRRERGFFARMHWKCCQSCGWAAVPEDHSGPIAFFHSQDSEDLKRIEDFGKGTLHIAFGHSNDEEGDTRMAGRLLAKTLAEEGLNVRWNGTTSERVAVVA